MDSILAIAFIQKNIVIVWVKSYLRFVCIFEKILLIVWFIP